VKRPPIFLTLGRVLQIHEEQLARFGGRAGVREMTLVESAIGMPRQSFGGEFVHDDLAGMAAAYFFHINMNQPFTDGNKRTGAAAAAIFLEINGVDFDVDPDEYAELGLALGAGKIAKADVTAFFRRHVRAEK
jgi:death on curing protein